MFWSGSCSQQLVLCLQIPHLVVKQAQTALCFSLKNTRYRLFLAILKAVMFVHVKCDSLLVHYLYADAFHVQSYFSVYLHSAWIPLTAGKCWGSQIETRDGIEMSFIHNHKADASVPTPCRFVLFTLWQCSGKQTKQEICQAKQKINSVERSKAYDGIS